MVNVAYSLRLGFPKSGLGSFVGAECRPNKNCQPKLRVTIYPPRNGARKAAFLFFGERKETAGVGWGGGCWERKKMRDRTTTRQKI